MQNLNKPTGSRIETLRCSKNLM